MGRKPFDLATYKATDKVVTRDGRSVRIICTDVKGTAPIIALITNSSGSAESANSFFIDGRLSVHTETNADLFVEEPEMWVNAFYPIGKTTLRIVPEYVYKSKLEAAKMAEVRYESSQDYIQVKLTIE